MPVSFTLFIVILVSLTALILNFCLFFTHTAMFAILRVMPPDNATIPGFRITYCNISQNSDAECSKGISFHTRYKIANVSTQALAAANRSYAPAITLTCLITSTIFLFLTFYAFSAAEELDSAVAVFSAGFVTLSCAGGIGIYAAFCLTLNKLTSSFKDIPNTKIKWGPGMPICWGILFSISVVMLLRVCVGSKRQSNG